MATCKECLHHGVCKDRDNLMLTVNNIFELMYQHGVEQSCVHFKSTADFVPKSEIDSLELTLQGVMWSVDKWLDGEELEQDEVNRAITMREKTLQIVDGLQEEIDGYKAELESEHLSRMDNIHELRAELANAKREVAKEIFAEIETSLFYKMVNEEITLMIREVDYHELKKKYTEEATE